MGEYSDLYFQSDTLLLADGFENFRKMCLKMYHLVKVELLTDISMVLMVEKGIRGRIWNAIP